MLMESYIELDKNMLVNETVGDVEITWYDVHEAPFSLHGFFEPKRGELFRRLPADVAEATSLGVDRLSRESAGGRVRFSTNSPYIAIRAKYRAVGRSPHLTLVSSAGFDLYTDGEFGSYLVKEFRMPYKMVDSYEQIIKHRCKSMRSYTINFPVHAAVESLEVGIAPDAALREARPYRDVKPIVFYGSSIVHGTAASRPGNIYPSIIGRELNVDHINLGFSGHAKGEPVLAKYMATLPMSVFVCDYDHNAPDAEHLEKTHHPLYEAIREKNPDVPFIMITRPSAAMHRASAYKKALATRDVIMASYLKARATGDEKVYFIDGMSFFSTAHQHDHLIDGLHPNDAGFMRMADGIGSLIRDILEKEFLKRS